MKDKQKTNPASARSLSNAGLGMDWTAERKRLEKVAKSKIVVTERMTVAEIVEGLKPFSGDLSVATALQWIEYRRTLAEGLAQHPRYFGTLGIHTRYLWSRLVCIVRLYQRRLAQLVLRKHRTSDILHQVTCDSPNVELRGGATQWRSPA